MKKLKENSHDKKEIKAAWMHIRTTTTKKLLQLKAKAYEMNLTKKEKPIGGFYSLVG